MTSLHSAPRLISSLVRLGLCSHLFPHSKPFENLKVYQGFVNREMLIRSQVRSLFAPYTVLPTLKWLDLVKKKKKKRSRLKKKEIQLANTDRSDLPLSHDKKDKNPSIWHFENTNFLLVFTRKRKRFLRCSFWKGPSDQLYLLKKQEREGKLTAISRA